MKIESYLESLSTQTRSAETLRAYRQDLTRFEAFLNEKGLEDTEVKPTTITEFISYLALTKGRTAGTAPAPATIARRLSVISAYYEWLRDDSDGAVVRNPAKRVKRPRVQNVAVRAPADDALATLVDGITDLRDKAIVLLFIYSGLRLQELRQLDTSTITSEDHLGSDGVSRPFGYGEIVGKGGKRRRFRVGPAAMLALGEYIVAFRLTDCEPALFLSSRRTRLSSRAIQQIVERWCKRLGLTHIHPHMCRHAFATRSINSGMSSVVLKELMGHSSLVTTQRYFHITPERLSREYFSTMEFVRLSSPV